MELFGIIDTLKGYIAPFVPFSNIQYYLLCRLDYHFNHCSLYAGSDGISSGEENPSEHDGQSGTHAGPLQPSANTRLEVHADDESDDDNSSGAQPLRQLREDVPALSPQSLQEGQIEARNSSWKDWNHRRTQERLTAADASKANAGNAFLVDQQHTLHQADTNDLVAVDQEQNAINPLPARLQQNSQSPQLDKPAQKEETAVQSASMSEEVAVLDDQPGMPQPDDEQQQILLPSPDQSLPGDSELAPFFCRSAAVPNATVSGVGEEIQQDKSGLPSPKSQSLAADHQDKMALADPAAGNSGDVHVYEHKHTDMQNPWENFHASSHRRQQQQQQHPAEPARAGQTSPTADPMQLQHSLHSGQGPPAVNLGATHQPQSHECERLQLKPASGLQQLYAGQGLPAADVNGARQADRHQYELAGQKLSPQLQEGKQQALTSNVAHQSISAPAAAATAGAIHMAEADAGADCQQDMPDAMAGLRQHTTIQNLHEHEPAPAHLPREVAIELCAGMQFISTSMLAITERMSRMEQLINPFLYAHGLHTPGLREPDRGSSPRTDLQVPVPEGHQSRPGPDQEKPQESMPNVSRPAKRGRTSLPNIIQDGL